MMTSIRSKAALLTAIAALAFGLSACDKTLLPVEFNYQAKDLELIIDSTTKDAYIELDTVVIDNHDWDSVLRANKVEQKDIQSIKIDWIEISPDSGRNDLLAQCDGFLFADGLGDKQIFYANYGATVAETEALTIYDVDLKAYLTCPKMYFRANALAGTSTREKSKIKVMLRYKVNAKI